MFKNLLRAVLLLLIVFPVIWPEAGLAQQTAKSRSKAGNGIQPSVHYPSYWQYKGKPLLLLGATDNDNLFQHPHIASHLDSLVKAGGNYIRNTMSDRDAGNERAFYQNPDGKYDLEKWNPVYWERFEKLLEETSKRKIIVQKEVCDRFDRHFAVILPADLPPAGFTAHLPAWG
ncbi:hypothetical protein EDD80_105138 [Anseongella ginsenosidimutans]|uniref:Uncharacterized protein n=1 Tax=Anseongella ginsenosidimutans TaxID=496056 RepID=A0A4R3KRL2_9SPHI|nr:hypothetical protein [Anseongella ginsenosidimutans]QEC52931.1 hypothetical protein FRZ59_11680 [Anseongella ginsenosidimutans]TCS87324.1 hypothetical protein EDD80_105138 [Anseongella ginsenosidimutans]